MHSTITEDVLANISTPIIDLGDLRTGTHSEVGTIAQTLLSVRNIPALDRICTNLPNSIQAVHSGLRSRAFEMYQKEIRKQKNPTQDSIFLQEEASIENDVARQVTHQTQLG